jgi:tetratricopeptide (TPR) repeat protein
MRVGVCILVLAAIAAAQDADWQAAVDRGRQAEQQGNYPDAIEHYRLAAALTERFNAHDGRKWTTYNQLGLAYADAGMIGESVRSYEREIAAIRKALGKQNAAYAIAAANLSTILLNAGDYLTAEKLLREALQIETQLPGARPLDIAVLQVRLSEALVGHRRSSEAERLLATAMTTIEASGDKFFLAVADNTTGMLRRRQHRYREALESFQEAVTLLEQNFGPSHAVLLHPLNNVAVAYSLAGNFSEAERVFRQAQAICDRMPPNHPMRADLLGNYAEHLERAGEKARAKAIRKTAEALSRDNAARNGLGLTVDVAAFRQ